MFSCVWKALKLFCSFQLNQSSHVNQGTDSNPFSLDAFAVFMFHVLQRVNHSGNLDKASLNAGYVLLMFYLLYQGNSRKYFEDELVERFSSLVNMPLLKPNKSLLPVSLRSFMEEGINLYNLHTNRHGRLEPTKGSYAQQWAKWEKKLRDTLSATAEYLNSVQVPFEFTAQQVEEQLRKIAKGEYTVPSIEKRKLEPFLLLLSIYLLQKSKVSLTNCPGRTPRSKLSLRTSIWRTSSRINVNFRLRVSKLYFCHLCFVHHFTMSFSVLILLAYVKNIKY